ncbi:dihydrodipicolinate synthase family protein [Amycolatopsis nigrescens]|uniref:dihydrodipicolinate synthase family protein n=1 Tax=Amycolatopsis nigrescens TaxID=381445 RepID=UPI000360F14B|nr:dihydrodipicolinate synthase family protein [Amycolatopsis nigrescens]
MRALGTAELHGVWASTLLPLNEDDTIDFGRLELEVDALIAAGPHGIYTNGSAGEFHTLAEYEYDRLHELVAGRCADAGVAFQLGAGHPSGQLSLDRIRRAAALRPGAIQVVLPDWLPLSRDETTAAVARMAEVADDVPLVLYNPPCAKTQLPPELFAELADAVPALIGIKVPGGDDDWYRRVSALVGGRLAVFVAGHTLASGLARGAAGAYSNVACLSPAGALRWYRLMHSDAPAALDVERRLQRFFRDHIAPLAAQGYCDPALDKTLAAIGGWAEIGTRVRWPHRSVPADLVPALRTAARAAVPELLG